VQATTISAVLDLFNTEVSWGSIKPGAPTPADEGPWLRLEDAAAPAVARRLAEQFQRLDGHGAEPLAVVGNYTFRELSFIPLLIQGAVFATQNRVVVLRDNLMFRDFEYYQHWRLLEPKAIVLPADPMASQPGVRVAPSPAKLRSELFGEIRRTYDPLIEGFRAGKFVAPANAWGALLDSLAEGFWQAGQHGLGLDNAWTLWQAAIEGRSFPTRRRPRRHRFEVEGAEPEDVSVRAGCCLWYMTDEARAAEELTHCYTCYLTSDAERVAYKTAHPHEEHEEEHATEESAV
jgi:hypothetical protein